jgi:hypothetical protein
MNQGKIIILCAAALKRLAGRKEFISWYQIERINPVTVANRCKDIMQCSDGEIIESPLEVVRRIRFPGRSLLTLTVDDK